MTNREMMIMALQWYVETRTIENAPTAIEASESNLTQPKLLKEEKP